MDNPMMPQQGQVGPMQQEPASGPASAPDPVQAMTAAHGQTAAQFKKLMQADKQLRAVRASLDSLVNMGDQVQDEDLIKAAGDLTAHGLSPDDLTKLVSQAPPGGGQALQGWLQQQNQDVTQKEAMLQKMLGSVQHQMGVDALHGLMALHMQHEQQQRQLASAPSANALMS